MPLWAFETGCALVVGLTLALAARRRGTRVVLLEWALLAAAAWAGEASCIAAYRFYGYAEGWTLWVGTVPLLVPLIWPLVIVSAREVAAALFPDAGRWRPLVVGIVVFIDASLMEVVAVWAGLWSWAEPGHLGVPLVGLWGWAVFAIAVDAFRGEDEPRRVLLAAALSPLLAHAGIVAGWWGLFRWTLRGELGTWGLIGFAVGLVVVTGLVARARASGHALERTVWGPRVIATALFSALLVTGGLAPAGLYAHVALVALPYLVATRL